MLLKKINLQTGTRNDDIAAFEMLFKTHYAGLVNYANTILRDKDASEEIVQEFFYNYWKNRKKLVFRISIKAYLYRSIRNNSLKYLEALAVRRRYADSILALSGESEGNESGELELAELNDLIDEILSELPERCSRIFRMSRFEGLKYDEIANELSVSVKTVEANMTRALKLLRERLEKYTNSGLLKSITK